MDNRLLAEGMLLGMSSFGMEIIKWDSDTLYIYQFQDFLQTMGLQEKS